MENVNLNNKKIIKKVKVGNPTLHKLVLTEELTEKYEVIEMTSEDKQKLFVNFEKDLLSQSKEFCKIIAEFTKQNDVETLYCAGHPTIDCAIQCVAQVFGLKVFRPIFKDNRPPVIEEFYELSTATLLGDRKLRFELEHL